MEDDGEHPFLNCLPIGFMVVLMSLMAVGTIAGIIQTVLAR